MRLLITFFLVFTGFLYADEAIIIKILGKVNISDNGQPVPVEKYGHIPLTAEISTGNSGKLIFSYKDREFVIHKGQTIAVKEVIDKSENPAYLKEIKRTQVAGIRGADEMKNKKNNKKKKEE